MENVRKGSLMMPAAPGNDYIPSMPSIPQHQLQQEQQPNPQKQQGPVSTPQPVSQSSPQPAYPPGQRPLPGGSKPFGNATRYTLTDPGSRQNSVQGSGGPGQVPPKKVGSPEPGRRPTPQQNKPSGQQPIQHGLPDQEPSPKPKPSQVPQPIISTLPPPGTGFDQGPQKQTPYKGAQTFQEMGIATAKIEEKDCLVM